MDDPPPERVIPPDRLVALGDGVFAIVMTLLVFQLSVPALADGDSLGEALVEMWPDFAVYVLSFLVLGVFWLIHHVLFDVIRRYDTPLIWLNIVFLMFAALIPFATDLVAVHGATTVTAVVYGANMIAVFGMGWAIWTYATRRCRLVDPGIDPDLVRGAWQMGLAYMGFMVPSLAVSFVSPIGAFGLYGCLVTVMIVTTTIGRGEVVLVWPGRHRTSDDDVEAARGGQSMR